MSNKSRRRVKIAAGAILAGAAIPIAAAGTAWADEPTTTDQTETAKQLEHQGLTHAEAQAVVTAEGNGTPVQVSYDGTTVVNDNQGSGPSTDASAVSDTGPKDVAAAIGAGSQAGAGAGTVTLTNVNGEGTYSYAILPGQDDTAFANGANTEAFSGLGNDDKAIANGAGSVADAGAGNHDTATANSGGEAAAAGYVYIPSGTLEETGSNEKATATGAGDIAVASSSNGSPGDHNTATVSGGTDSFAFAEGGSHDSAKVKGSDSSAAAGFGYDKDKAFADGSDLTADADDKNDQHVTVHPSGGGAEATPLTDLHMPVLPLP
jgi:hypothetical protein